ncbi:MAG: ISH6 family transposase [Candidatus Bathyarchaeales archaeon]
MKVSLECTNASFHIDIAEIIENINGHSKFELVRQIQKRQEQIITQLCGPKHSRNYSFKRAGSYTKELVTAIGTVNFKVQKVKSRADNTINSPILEYMDLKRRKYSKDLRMKLAEYASKMSYQDASIEFETATGIHVPKRTIHRFVQEIAPKLLKANNPENEPEGKTESLMGDSTEVRALASREMNMVHVLISPDSGQLLHLEVNKDWPNCKTETLISDKEPALTNAIATDNCQLCILHAIKYLLFTLWGEGMSKDDREKVKRSIKEALFTLAISTKKHLQDRDAAMLQDRIDKTLKVLDEMAKSLEGEGYVRAAEFLKKNSRFVVTFAQLALQGAKIPYTTNRIERLMGEVSKRCKHNWMHWSTRGLKDILTIVLVRYTNKPLYDNFKNAYIHNATIH